jgi:hypothetical protein
MVRNQVVTLDEQVSQEDLNSIRNYLNVNFSGWVLSEVARHPVRPADIDPKRLHKTLLTTYERAPDDFESLLGIAGVGPKSLRALALVAELIHGARASTRDPARFAFAHGGKDGTPFPVDRGTYDQTIELLRGALDRARLDHADRAAALKRLAGFADEARPRPRFRA